MEFNFVYFKDINNIRTFIKSKCDEISNEIIFYTDVINKLTKNDLYNKEPSIIIVSSTLMRMLEKTLKDETKTQIFYIISKLDEDIIDTVVSYVENFNDEFNINLYINSNEDIKFKLKDDILIFSNLFDKVYELDYENKT